MSEIVSKLNFYSKEPTMDRRTAFISSALALAAVGTATTATASNKGGFKRTVLLSKIEM